MTVRDNEPIQMTEEETNRYKRAFQWIKHVFMNSKIMLPNGELYQLDGCIPSGSYFTQLIGSMINLVVTMTLYRLQGIEAQRIRVLGDDSLVHLKI